MFPPGGDRWNFGIIMMQTLDLAYKYLESKSIPIKSTWKGLVLIAFDLCG
jgi:hypothetical protein